MFGKREASPNPAASPRAAEELKADDLSEAEYEKRRYDITVGAFDRSKGAAAAIGATASAIATVYAGIVGVVFSAAGTGFPLRGTITPVFLGLALVLSTYYVAFVTNPRKDTFTPPGAKPYHVNVEDRLAVVNEIVMDSVSRRGWALRSSVFALAFGLAAIPLSFLSGSAFESAQDATAPDRPQTIVNWPKPDLGTPVELEKIRYQAEVTKFVADMKEPAAPAGLIAGVPFYLATIGVGVVVTFTIPPLLSRASRRKGG